MPCWPRFVGHGGLWLVFGRGRCFPRVQSGVCPAHGERVAAVILGEVHGEILERPRLPSDSSPAPGLRSKPTWSTRRKSDIEHGVDRGPQ